MAPLVIVVELGVQLERLLVHLEGVIEGNQVVVKVDDIGHSGDHLLLEREIVGRQIIAGLVVRPLVHGQPEPVQ